MAEPYEQETRWSMNRDDIPWMQIFIEGVAIVLSILLAFAIDAWWERRGEIAEEREILIGLNAEFVDLQERLMFWEGHLRTGSDLIEQFLSDDVESMSLEDMDLMFLHAALLANVLDQGGALDALLASGRLEMIGNTELRARLGKYPDLLEDIHTNDLSKRKFAMEQIAPYLARAGIPRELCPEGELTCTQPGPVPREYLRLARDSELRALLITRRLWMWYGANDHKNAYDEATEILKLIDQRMSEISREL